MDNRSITFPDNVKKNVVIIVCSIRQISKFPNYAGTA
jgi:hypothetical protein